MPTQNSLKEIEIKLYTSNQTLEKIYQHPLFTKYSHPIWQEKELLNQYIDTEFHDLTAAKVALRVRKDREQYIQTLKAKGYSIGGFSERDEFDWMISSPQLDLSVLNEKYWPKKLENIDKTKLMTIFSTDFIRNYALFTWQINEEKAEIEVAIDRGVVKAREKQEAICELELELRDGSANILLKFAIELAKLFPLFPSDTSKAERGYRLIGSTNYQFMLCEPSTNSPPELLQHYLITAQRLLERCVWSPSKPLFENWIKTLQQLSHVLEKLELSDLLVQLNDIKNDWLFVSQADEKLLINKVQQEMDTTRWGVFSLSTSLWLLNHY